MSLVLCHGLELGFVKSSAATRPVFACLNRVLTNALRLVLKLCCNKARGNSWLFLIFVPGIGKAFQDLRSTMGASGRPHGETKPEHRFFSFVPAAAGVGRANIPMIHAVACGCGSKLNIASREKPACDAVQSVFAAARFATLAAEAVRLTAGFAQRSAVRPPNG